jgi:hypothetical protein
VRLEIHYRWQIQSHTGRWIKTRYAASDEFIRKQHLEAIPIEGSRTEQVVLDQPAELIAASFHGPRPIQSVLIWPCKIAGQDGRISLMGLPSNYTITQEGEEWVVMLNGVLLMYRGPGPVQIESKA